MRLACASGHVSSIGDAAAVGAFWLLVSEVPADHRGHVRMLIAVRSAYGRAVTLLGET